MTARSARGGRSETGRNPAADRKLVDLGRRVPVVLFQLRALASGELRFEYVGPQIGRLYGVSAGEVLRDARAWLGRIVEDDRNSVQPSIQQAMRDVAEWTHLHRAVSGSGGVNWVLVQAAPQPLGDGNILWHGAMTEVSWLARCDMYLVETMQRFDNSLSEQERLIEADARWLEGLRRNLLVRDRAKARDEFPGRRVAEPAAERRSRHSGVASERRARGGAQPASNELELSRREQQVLLLVARGLSSKAIARQLGLAVNTVSAHRRNIRKKTGAKTVLDLTMYALTKHPMLSEDR